MATNQHCARLRWLPISFFPAREIILPYRIILSLVKQVMLLP